MLRKLLPVIIILILLVAVFVLWGVSKNIFVNNVDIKGKIVYGLRNNSKIIIGKYYLQTVVDQKEIAAMRPDVAVLFKIQLEANVTVDFSKIKPEDIVIDKDSKVISVNVPVPEFTELSIRNPELIYEKVPFYRNDEEIRNQIIQRAKDDVQNRLQNLRNSNYNIMLVETFVKDFVRKILGEEYTVTVTFGS